MRPKSRIPSVGNVDVVQEDLIPTRQSLLGRLRNWRDDDSWRDFFQTYWQLIYNTSLRAGLSPVEAEEVVQETVIAVSKSIGEFRYNPEGSFKGWLLTRTRWQINEHFRRRKRDPARPGNSEESLENAMQDARSESAFEELWEAEWEHNMFEAALARLKEKVEPRVYQVFDLHVLRDWPAGKVAETLKVSVATVYVTKHRLKAMLKAECKKIEESGIT